MADVVFIDSLRLSANIGPDCWDKERQQPVEVTIYIHLKETFMKAAGESDNVLDSVHYGHVTKEVSALIGPEQHAFKGADDLIHSVTECVFALAKDAADEVRVVLDVPKMILLAGGFSIDVTTKRGDPFQVIQKRVWVKDIIIPVIIGVNPPEREAKQRVIVNITFIEVPKLVTQSVIDYRSIVSKLIKAAEATEYLTLEKFVMELVRSACLSSDLINAATVRAQKPSALSFAQSSGVEITRTREAFTK